MKQTLAPPPRVTEPLSSLGLYFRYLTCSALLLVSVLVFKGAAQNPGVAPHRVDKVELGKEEVKRLLLLMDTDKNGKISKEEFMKFMEAEFDRLDVNHDGELDARELTKSRVRASKFSTVGK